MCDETRSRVEPGSTAPLLEFPSSDCFIFLFLDPLLACTSPLVQRPWSPANREASTRAVKANSANGGVLKAGMVDVEEKPACCCHTAPRLRTSGGRLRVRSFCRNTIKPHQDEGAQLLAPEPAFWK